MIYKISQFLKADNLKVIHASSILVSSYSNKRLCLNFDNSALLACSHLICFFKKLCHLLVKCWELHPEYRPVNHWRKIKLSDIKIKDIISSVMKDNTPTFNISSLSKIFAITFSFSKKNL